MTDEQIKTKGNMRTAIIVAVVVIVVGISIFSSESEVAIVENPESSYAPNEYKPTTVADAWQGGVKSAPTLTELNEKIKEAPNADEDLKENEVKLDYANVHKEIGDIRLTESGDVVVDAIALRALQRAFPSGRLNYTPELMEELQEIIKQGLPGNAGEQAAQIVKNYYDYAIAKQELNEVYRDVQVGRKDHDETIKEEKALRELYLGKEISEQLFEQEDRDAEYMLRAMEISMNKDLTKEEKIEQRAALTQEFTQPDVTNWSRRYSAYRAELKSIQNSGLSEGDKASAVSELKDRHFSAAEQTAITEANVSLDL